MNKKEFVRSLSKELKVKEASTRKVLDTVLKCIAESMKNDDYVKFMGFGTFRVKKVRERQVKTPKGIIVNVPSQRRVTFSVGKYFKDIVNNKC